MMINNSLTIRICISNVKRTKLFPLTEFFLEICSWEEMKGDIEYNNSKIKIKNDDNVEYELPN